MKAEALPKGTNTRFVATTRIDEPTAVHDWNVVRGESENWINDLKTGCSANRLSCHRFWTNQFRMPLLRQRTGCLDTLRRGLHVHQGHV